MMIMSLSEIQEMILFCKQHKVKAAKFGEVSFEFSEASLYADDTPISNPQKEETSSSKSLVDTEEPLTPQEYEDLLFHSSNS